MALTVSDLYQLFDGIYIDTTNGVSGTALGVGSPVNPVNNLADARTIADRENLQAYVIVASTIILTQNHLAWTFIGKNNGQVSLAGYDVSGSDFKSCGISGIMVAPSVACNFFACTLNGVTNVSGTAVDCLFEGTIVLSGELVVKASSCNVDEPNHSIFDVDHGGSGAKDLRISQWSGGIEIVDVGTGSVVTVDTVSGHVVLDPTITGGIVTVRGVGRLSDNSAGGTIDKGGFVEALNINIFNTDPAVYIDTDLPTSGTLLDWGTATRPVNNIVDAYIVADRENVTRFKFRGDLILDRNASNFSFIGLKNKSDNTIDFNGQNTQRSFFFNCVLSGTASGRIEAVSCTLEAISGLEGTLKDCGFADDLQTPTNAKLSADGCFSQVAGTNTPTVNVGLNTNLSMRHYSGGLKIENFTIGCVGSIDLDSGHLIIDTSGSGGVLVVRGVGHLTEQVGHSVTLVTDGLVEGTDTRLSRKILANKLITDPDTGILTIYDDDGSVLLTAQIFEDAQGVQPYRGSGAELRNKLS